MKTIKGGVLCGVDKNKDFEFFDFVLKEEFDDKYEGLRKLEERGAPVMYRIDLPAKWQNKSIEECQEIVKTHKFDFSMLSCSFKHQCPTTKADIQFLLQFPELKCLDICGDELDLEDIKALIAFKNLDRLSIACRQFGDEIVPYLLQFEELISLHVDVEKMTEAGARELETGIAKGTDLFLPMNLRDC